MTIGCREPAPSISRPRSTRTMLPLRPRARAIHRARRRDQHGRLNRRDWRGSTENIQISLFGSIAARDPLALDARPLSTWTAPPLPLRARAIYHARGFGCCGHLGRPSPPSAALPIDLFESRGLRESPPSIPSITDPCDAPSIREHVKSSKVGFIKIHCLRWPLCGPWNDPNFWLPSASIRSDLDSCYHLS